jgi:transcriptional regulator with XRE-family HTH domain
MSSWFRATPESEALLAEERLVLAATESVYEAMENAGVNSRQLAAKLGVRPSEISQRLSGRRNLTLRSLAAMLHVLGMKADISISPTDLGASKEEKDQSLRRSEPANLVEVTSVTNTNITNIQINLHPSSVLKHDYSSPSVVLELQQYLDRDVPQLPEAVSPVIYWNGRQTVGSTLEAVQAGRPYDTTESAAT